MGRRFLGFMALVSGLLVAMALVPLIASAQTATPAGTGTAATGTGTAGAGTGTAGAGTATTTTGTGTAAVGTGTAAATTAATTAATATRAATATTAATATRPAATGVGGAATSAPPTTIPATGHPSDRGAFNYALLAVVLLALGTIGVGLGVRRKVTRS